MTIKVIHVRVQIIIKGHSKRKREKINTYKIGRRSISIASPPPAGPWSQCSPTYIAIYTVQPCALFIDSSPVSQCSSSLVVLCVDSHICVAVYFMLSFLKHIALPLLSRVSYSFAKFRHSNGISCICISISHVEWFKRWIYWAYSSLFLSIARREKKTDFQCEKWAQKRSRSLCSL